MRKIILLILALTIFSNLASAIAITPPEKSINFEGKTQDSCGFNFKTQGDTFVTFRVEGDLKEYINFTEPPNKVKGGIWHPVECILNIPADLKPGYHEVNIILVEGKNPGGLGAVAGIIFPTRVFVPYPGKYLEIQKYELNDVAINETAPFKLTVISRGDEIIEKASAIINIIYNGKIIKSLQTNSARLEKHQTAELKASWDTTGIPAGIYQAEAIINYDDKQARETKEIKVGDLRIDISRIKHDKILTKHIAKFDVELKSVWNSIIKDAYLTLELLDNDNNPIKSVRGENFAIGPWSTIVQNMFLDTGNILPGKYKGNFTVFHSGGRTTQKSIELEITESLFDKYPITTVGLVAVIVLLLILLLINLRKKHEAK